MNKENREGHEPTEGPGGPGREARVLLSLSSAAGVWPEGGGRRPLERFIQESSGALLRLPRRRRQLFLVRPHPRPLIAGSFQLYDIDAEQRATICVVSGPAIEALPVLFSRFPNLHKVENNYSGWAPGNGSQIDNQGLRLLSFSLPLLNDLTLSFCSEINDSGLAGLTNCKMLMFLKLNSTPEITSRGLLSLAIGCKTLSSLHLNNCKGIASSTEWLDYLGNEGSLGELVVKNCKGIGSIIFQCLAQDG